MNIEQIEGIKKSCRLSAETLVFIEPYIQDGITSIQLNNLMEEFIVKSGGIPAPLGYKGFPAATCISINDIVCHGIPDDTVLKNGDIVGVDVATILNGYFGDTCYTFPVGDISKKNKRLLDIAKNSLYIGIRQCKAGNYLGNIGYEINHYVDRSGYSVCDSYTGHATGLSFHSEPTILHVAEKNSGDKITENLIFTVEPIINSGTPEVIIEGWLAKTSDGSLSAQYEHTILVGKNGAEILTDSELWSRI